ncbi:MAG: hypothetical protein ACI9EF_002856 [Pseudohongiellaceae bacterium]|jgi:hypothetical protein
MNAWLFATVLCLCPSPLASDEVVVQAGSLALSQDEFSAWLIQRVGHSHVEEFAMERLIVAAAIEQGLAPTAAELDRLCDAARSKLIDDTFRGDEEAYINDLVARGLSLENHGARRRAQLEPEICLQRLARNLRVITDDMLRARYKVIYGELGEGVAVEVLFYSLYHGLSPDSPRLDRDAQALVAEALAKKGADALKAERPLAELLPTSDTVNNDFVIDGYVNRWRKNLLGSESELALASLDNPGDVSPAIRVWDGYLVLRLIERKTVSFEEARAELTALLGEDPPNSEELGLARSLVRNKQDIEIRLR